MLWLVKVELLVVVDELDGVELLTVVLVVLSPGGSPPLELQPASPAASNNDATALIIAFMPHPRLRMDLSLRQSAAHQRTRQNFIQSFWDNTLRQSA